MMDGYLVIDNENLSEIKRTKFWGLICNDIKDKFSDLKLRKREIKRIETRLIQFNGWVKFVCFSNGKPENSLSLEPKAKELEIHSFTAIDDSEKSSKIIKLLFSYLKKMNFSGLITVVCNKTDIKSVDVYKKFFTVRRDFGEKFIFSCTFFKEKKLTFSRSVTL